MESSPDQPPLRDSRGSRPDAETIDKVYLIKNVSQLHATYQVRLLAFMAHQRGKKLILVVPQACRFETDLGELMGGWPDAIGREDLR